VAVSLILVFSETLTTIGVAISLWASIFMFFCGIYDGFLGIKYERLQQKFESFVNPLVQCPVFIVLPQVMRTSVASGSVSVASGFGPFL
jgi:hypothetical protein